MNIPSQAGTSGSSPGGTPHSEQRYLRPLRRHFRRHSALGRRSSRARRPRAALVIDFRDGSPALLYGYRWGAQESKTGIDMLNAILGADAALTVDSIFFPNSISRGARSRSFSDNGTPGNYLDDSYWGYWVNNDVYYHPDRFHSKWAYHPPRPASRAAGQSIRWGTLGGKQHRFRSETAGKWFVGRLGLRRVWHPARLPGAGTFHCVDACRRSIHPYPPPPMKICCRAVRVSASLLCAAPLYAAGPFPPGTWHQRHGRHRRG